MWLCSILGCWRWNTSVENVAIHGMLLTKENETKTFNDSISRKIKPKHIFKRKDCLLLLLIVASLEFLIDMKCLLIGIYTIIFQWICSTQSSSGSCQFLWKYFGCGVFDFATQNQMPRMWWRTLSNGSHYVMKYETCIIHLRQKSHAKGLSSCVSTCFADFKIVTPGQHGHIWMCWYVALNGKGF